MTGPYLGFPPRRHYLTLPAGNRQIALQGLGLYDATFLHQRFALASGRLLLGLGLEFPFRLRYDPPVPEWWDRWLAEVAEPLLGPVAHTAFRLPGQPGFAQRVTVLLFGADARPLAFGKLLARDEPSALSVVAQEELTANPPASFHIPHLLAHGRFDNMAYQLHEILPAGPHRQPDFDPAMVHRVIDELQDRLGSLPRTPEIPESHVPAHTDFLSINFRRAADGNLWLIDWDNVDWAPPLTDELAYWMGGVARRFGPTGRRRIEQVRELLRSRGTDEQIATAIAWRKVRRAVEAIKGEQIIRDGL
ncbi:MAG: hypothetical protein V3S60_00060 [Acidimicrobiia bacterium]